MYRSWFCTFNNPAEHGYSDNPQECCDAIVAAWVDGHPTRSCAVAFCVSSDGLRHCHAVLEDVKNMRFSVIKKAFPSMHVDPTKGSKEQAEDYINKRGKFEEKGEKVLATARYGEIKGFQGQRRDLLIIEDLIAQGMKPNKIMRESLSYRKYEKIIRDAYYDKRSSEISPKREVSVYWYCGESGSGKTYTYVELCEKYGEEDVYILTDYDKGGFDNYAGEKILCMDEFRGQMRFALLMNYLDGYKVQIPCRYSNALALWDEVHIFTVMPPELVYKKMVEENRGIDSYEQLKRRIDFMVYKYKDDDNNRHTIQIPMSEYISYDDLKAKAKVLSNDNPFTNEPGEQERIK